MTTVTQPTGISISPVPADESPMPSPDPISAALNEKAHRLFSYLREVTALNLAKVTNVDRYERVIWLADVPETDGCYTVVRLPPDERVGASWIDVRRRAEPACPNPPAICNAWFSPAALARHDPVPSLYDRIQVAPTDPRTGEPAKFTTLAENPKISAAWDAYLEAQWHPWVAVHKVWQKHQAFYNDLFTIEQQAKRLGEAYEIVLGLGLLVWKPADSPLIRRHLVVARAHLKFEPETGAIILDPAPDGARPTMEYEMVDPASRPSADTIRLCETGAAACSDDVFVPAMETMLRSWAHAMTSEASYLPDIIPATTGSNKPVVYLAPALILRQRNRRSMIAFLGSIADRLKAMASGDIPFGVRRLCEVVDEAAPESGSETASTIPRGPGNVETFFPLASNDEQREIAARLRNNRGILVQGPPGTGKSQTIANLICHLLAEGKRVLVTSQTERALKVLNGKLPPQIQPLCVTVLGAGDAELRNMEASVQGISQHWTDWDPARADREIAVLESTIRNTREAKNKAEARLREIRGREVISHSLMNGVFVGTAPAIARRIEEQRARLGWIPDKLPVEVELPVSVAQVQHLVDTLIRFSPERRLEIVRGVCVPRSVPDTQSFAELCRQEKDALENSKQYGDLLHTANTRRLMEFTDQDRAALRRALEEFQIEQAKLRAAVPAWSATALTECLSGRGLPWEQLHALLQGYLADLDGKLEKGSTREVFYPSNKDRSVIRGDAESLLAHLKAGKGFGFWIFRSEVVRRAGYVVRECRVNGQRCDKVEALEDLVEHLTMERMVEIIWSESAPHFTPVSGTLRRQLAEIALQFDLLGHILSQSKRAEQVRATIERHGSLIAPVWHQDAEVARFLGEVVAADAARQLANLAKAFRSIEAEIETAAADPMAHACTQQLLAALRDRSVPAFAEASAVAAGILADRNEWAIATETRRKLAEVAPMLVQLIEQAPADPTLKDRLVTLISAWDHRRAASWLEAYANGCSIAETEMEVRRIEKQLAGALESLAAKLAWRHCMDRLTAEQREHMMAWTKAIRRIGKGTGKRAIIHRESARGHMESARGAIPAWIMPFYRVAETAGDQPEPYDVVVVDEASQSGPEACALMYLGKQIVVVGDDQQISPEAVGINRDDVDMLRNQYLQDFVHADALGVEESLFSQAQIRFGGRIRLKEHFRCMPEIISFSNQLCYRDEPLLPLRQYPPKRLPPIITRFVEGGVRTGGSTNAANRPEAEAVADAIIECIDDPRYAGKTMGVISLLGETQAQIIRQLVVERVDAREIEGRVLTFGDAYSFQGDERDVMFMSMVAAPNVANAALTGTKAVQARR